MANGPTREAVRDPNAERAARNERVQDFANIDTFAPTRSNVSGNPVQQGPLGKALVNFGTKLGAKQMEKQANENFLHGQALRASGAALAEGAPPPTRKGYKAMEAKLTVEQWASEQRAAVEAGDNGIDALEYPSQVSQRFRDILGDDSELNAMMTTAALPLISDLSRFQAQANVKRRRAEAINQATSDVTNNVRSVIEARKSGDQEGEAAARQRLLGAMGLGNLTSPELRQQTYADLAALSLDMGEPTVLNYVRSQGIEFSPEQEKAIVSAQGRYDRQKRTELDLTYQHDLADFEANVGAATTLEQVRTLAAEQQARYPDRKTNDYFVSLEDQWRTNLNKTAGTNVLRDAHRQGTVAYIPGAKSSAVQEAVRQNEQEIDETPALSPLERQQRKIGMWKDNNTVYDHYKTQWNAGMTNPFLDNGDLNPAFDEAYKETITHYRANPDLAMRHLNDENRHKFLAMKNLTEYGGMELRDAAALIRQNAENVKELTADQRNRLRKEVDGNVDSIMGRGFSWRNVTDTVGATQPIKNEGMVRERITRLATTYMQTGYPDAEAAVEAARVKIMESHEQVGNSLVYNGGTPLSEQMGGITDVEGAINYQKEQIAEFNPDLDTSRLVLMGDPLSNGILYGHLNEFDVIDQVISADLSAAGEAYRQDVLLPKEREFQSDMASAHRERARKAKLVEEAVESGIYTKSQAEAALSNFVGSFVLDYRLGDFRDEKRSAKDEEQMRIFRENQIESTEQWEAWKRMHSAYKSNNTPEQNRLLQAGRLEEYEASKAGPFFETALTDLARWEGTEGGKAIENDSMTRGYGITSVSPQEAAAIENMNDQQAALTIIQMRDKGMRKEVTGYPTAPDSIQHMALDMSYNSGRLFPGQKKALASMDYQEFARQTLDVIAENDDSDGATGVLTGLVKRRAYFYNRAAKDQQFPELDRAEITPDGVKYYDTEGNEVMSVRKNLHPRAQPGVLKF